MTKQQIKVFEELLKDKDFKGKKALKHLLWLNTSKPKFKVGDCFIVSDPGHRIGNFPVKDFKAKIIEISSWRDEEDWFYHLECFVEINGRQTTTNVHKYETDLDRAIRCEDNVNVLT